MNKESNLAHWETWAANHGAELRATTKCMSIKRLEIEAFVRNLQKWVDINSAHVLEIGCGNGFNGFALVESCPNIKYIGADFSPTMITNATKIASTQSKDSSSKRLSFCVLDARKLSLPFQVDQSQEHWTGASFDQNFALQSFDAIFTDRMLINLASAEEQLEVMRRISKALKPGGVFLMIENSTESHAKLNEVRKVLGLDPRPPASYNIFINQQTIDTFKKEMKLVHTEYFGAVHDLMLYAAVPAANGGQVEYDTALMKTLTDALLYLHQSGVQHNLPYGQNALWVWQKT